MSVKATFNQDNKTLTIAINGRFDFSAHTDFRNAYSQIDNNNIKVTIDMRNVEYMDSSALGMLLLLDEHFSATRIKIINCNDYIKQLLDIANFNKKFDIS